MALAPGAVATAFALCGCETTMQRSAELERRAHHVALERQGVSVSRENPAVKVVQTTVVRGNEASAVVVVLRNISSHPLRDAPIEIAVHDAKGAVLYSNDTPGLDPSLTHVSLLMPGQEISWVDDQVQLSGTPAGASALVGEGARAPVRVPELAVSPTHRIEEPSLGVGAAGTVANRSSVAQHNLIVDVVARRGGEIVAAGRAVVAEAPASASSPFQTFFIGNPQGAQIQASAPPTTF